MTPETLRALLAREEGPNLEFKLEYVLDGPGKDRNRAEVAKDLLALVNSAGRAAKDAAHLILGAGDKLQGEGSHAAKDSKGLYSRRTFLDILNARSTPPVHDLEYDDVELDGVTYGVLTIPPSTAIHYLTQDLVTPKGSWRKNSVLIRHGDQVGIASPEEIARLVSQKTTSSRGASASWSQVDLLEASLDPEDSPYSHSSPITSDKANEEPIPADIQAELEGDWERQGKRFEGRRMKGNGSPTAKALS